MRVRARKDSNHAEIVKTFRQIGAQVIDIAQLGNGIPDLLCTYAGRTFIVEVKDGNKPPSARALTPDEREFHATWRGEIYIINSINEAIELLNKIRKAQYGN